jgi:hypothetical protein
MDRSRSGLSLLPMSAGTTANRACSNPLSYAKVGIPRGDNDGTVAIWREGDTLDPF